MSILIELSQATQRLAIEQQQPQNFIPILKQVLSNSEFELKHFSQVQEEPGFKKNQILVILGKSSRTFVRDMEWRFFILPTELRLKIKFFNEQRDNFLKAKTERMKLQLMILLRSLNSQMLSEEEIIINPANGLLQYHFRISWKQYKVKIPKIQALRRFLLYLISKLSQFEELIYFCQPPILTNNDQNSQRLHLFDDFLKITNNFRTIMKNTINMRRMNSQIVGRLQQLREYKPKNQIQQNALKQQKQHMMALFQHNVSQIYQGSIGLQKNKQNQEIHAKCLQNIAYHQNFKDKNNIEPSQKLFASNPENKIVYGINVVKSDKEKVFSKQGAHSQITRGVFLFRLIKSIDCDVVKQDPSRWLMGTQRKSQLTVKRCNQQNQASKNSFMNQLYFLNHVRDFHSSFIGKYYLEAKSFRQRNQKEPIYMKSYYRNVDYMVRKCATLSIRDKLSLLYRISLGLCFLSSKNILHRDFKPHNIVVNSQLTPHIIDFGSCCSVFNATSFAPYDKRLLTTKFIHIYYHQLPEKYHYIYQKMSKDEYEQHPLFDVYSFGRMICFVMFGTLDTPHYQTIADDPHAQLLKNLIFLVEMCLSVDPDDRPGIGEATGFLGSLSKFYSVYNQYFNEKTSKKSQKRTQSQPNLSQPQC